MVNIYLTGKLGRMFGPKWELDVKSPGEALRAIDANLRGALFEYLRGPGAKKPYKIAIQKKDNLLTKEEINNPSGSGDIYIMPTISGSGDSAVGKIIIGILIIVAAIYTGGTALYAANGATVGGLFGAATTTVAYGLAAAGFSLVLGGVTQLLTPTPKFGEGADSTQKQSRVIGNATTISQGGGVPIPYGRVLISPMPISISSSSYDLPSSDANIGSVDVTELPGGGYEYN